MNLMDTYHRRWDDDDCVKKFSEKKQADFFKSEIYFIEKIAQNLQSILDIGCASGRFIELLRYYIKDFKFHGIDISRANIDNGNKLYPEYKFEHLNALDFQSSQKFDLVNATGVCQHEPEFEKLIKKMVELSCLHTLFDIKIANINEHIVDQNLSYSGKENRLYFIILSLPRLIEYLSTIRGISTIEIYGYVTMPNKNTVIPDDLGQIVSANILITKGKSGNSEVECIYNLPDIVLPGR